MEIRYTLVFLENVGYTVLGGSIAAIFGFGVQWWHTIRERKNDIKKIRGLLKPEFEDLYQILIDEMQVVKKAKDSSEEDFNSLNDHTMGIAQYLANVGSGRLLTFVWDPIISSGNLIKLDNDEIEIILSAQQSVRRYNKNMDELQNVAENRLEKQCGENPAPNVINMPDVEILDEYLDGYERAINMAINGFKLLDKLPWFDHDKIKNTAQTVNRYTRMRVIEGNAPSDL